ncbi:hypothetical protein T459_02562 [Capsicum annuum]|uniref:Kinesin motor domain-containing protein n=1 Tax=Capsicum annuum TaxID=4072 RepID=A0A2G3AKE8_CAPAN|nr:hypothetical protein T459_02562 [Capsicum annuum]
MAKLLQFTSFPVFDVYGVCSRKAFATPNLLKELNLKIMDDPRDGFYVENIIEEYVSTYEDGLSSRKVGSTSINSKSSRSLIGFTCIIESWCKESSSTRFGSSKLSRMSLVDLAGFDKNIPDDAGKQFVKEGKYVKKSTSLLGYLICSEESEGEEMETMQPEYCSSIAISESCHSADLQGQVLSESPANPAILHQINL